MAATTYHPVRISTETLDTLRQWSRRHNGYSTCESSFLDMVTMAQKLTGSLRPTDSLEIVDDSRTLKQFIGGEGAERVIGSNFMSFLYRDANGVDARKPNPLGVCAERPFDHADVFLLPSEKFNFLSTARQRAVAFGAEPQLSEDDVAAAIVDNLQNVSRDGGRYHHEGLEFKIRRASPANA